MVNWEFVQRKIVHLGQTFDSLPSIPLTHLVLSFRLKMPGRQANSACFGKLYNTDACFEVHITVIEVGSTLSSSKKKANPNLTT